MNARISRRTFVTASSFAIATAAMNSGAFARSSHQGRAGAIGWIREAFDSTYGPGEQAGDMMLYANPFLEGSQLTVFFENDVATFIDISIPGASEFVGEALFQNLLPQDAVSQGSWNLPSADGTPNWVFGEYYAESMNMAGSGATLIQTTTATNDNVLARATISLATPEAASGVAPAEGSIGPGASMDEWTGMYGEGMDGHAATGHYDATWLIDPWEKVIVYSVRGQESQATLTSISALNSLGTDPDAAFESAQTFLPQGAQLRAGYSSYPVADRNQGWGVSTWDISETERVLLFMLGAGDDSGDVLQAASMLYVAN